MFIPTAIFVKKTEICKSADNKKTAAFSRERLPSIGASNRLPYIPTLSNQYINHISKNSFPFFGNPAFRRSGVLVVAIAPQLPDGCPLLIHIDLFSRRKFNGVDLSLFSLFIFQTAWLFCRVVIILDEIQSFTLSVFPSIPVYMLCSLHCLLLG